MHVYHYQFLLSASVNWSVFDFCPFCESSREAFFTLLSASPGHTVKIWPGCWPETLKWAHYEGEEESLSTINVLLTNGFPRKQKLLDPLSSESRSMKKISYKPGLRQAIALGASPAARKCVLSSGVIQFYNSTSSVFQHEVTCQWRGQWIRLRFDRPVVVYLILLSLWIAWHGPNQRLLTLFLLAFYRYLYGQL